MSRSFDRFLASIRMVLSIYNQVHPFQNPLLLFLQQERGDSSIIILDLEVNGATKLLEENNKFKGIFIDIDDYELINRLKNRGHDASFIKKRMKLANLQREKKELYQYHVDNEDIKTSVKQILDIIYALEESW